MEFFFENNSFSWIIALICLLNILFIGYLLFDKRADLKDKILFSIIIVTIPIIGFLTYIIYIKKIKK